ncbi:MAG: class I SAM-dependent methyltransferase [Ectothiorhodospiraceae bacterium]|nr:class I SAM-dependent methyltransferase [Ectothiorhodospiraceae bacterium]
MPLAITLSGLENAADLAQLQALAQKLSLPICDISKPGACAPSRFSLSFINQPSLIALSLTASSARETPLLSENAEEPHLATNSLGTNDSETDSAEMDFAGYSTHSSKILALSSTREEFKGNIHIDFVHGKLGHRREFGGGRGQPLARAIGLKHGANPTVVDATAGLGRDAFVLASLGAQVTMIERSPILAALLDDGLKRLAAELGFSEPGLSDIAEQQLHLVHANAIEWLQNQTENRPDVVYMDPMYPHRSKSALVKKEMRALRALVGDDEDSALLLQAARCCALKRVVVKRPKGAPLIGDGNNPVKPSGNVQSKNTRYDIYSVIPSV